MPTGPRPPRAVTTVHTERLTLRPLTAHDADDERILGWHTDPSGYELTYEPPFPDLTTASQHLHAWVRRWEIQGIGYWIAEQNGRPVGIGGVDELQHEGTRYLNLSYRLDPTVRGSGLGREMTRAATSFAAEWWPDLPVVARIAPRNTPSLRTAYRAGLTDAGTWWRPHEPAGNEMTRHLQTPVVRVDGVQVGTSEYNELLDLWCAVIETGGSVGFERGAPRGAVKRTLDLHLDGPTTTLVRLHAATPASLENPSVAGELLGFGFVVGLGSVARHRCTLKRVMTDPQHRGANLGRLLMGALHATARANDYELVQISYRGGTGLEKFYEKCGYVETGRVPGGLRFSFGDRDDVDMTRRLDGQPLR
ncbi:GNAT family N-acetyltransferase [Dermatophilaceae bacterium Sec6.4]